MFTAAEFRGGWPLFNASYRQGREIMKPAQDATVSNMDELASALTTYHQLLLFLSLEQGRHRPLNRRNLRRLRLSEHQDSEETVRPVVRTFKACIVDTAGVLGSHPGKHRRKNRTQSQNCVDS